MIGMNDKVNAKSYSVMSVKNGYIELVVEKDLYDPIMLSSILGKYRKESVRVKIVLLTDINLFCLSKCVLTIV